MKSQITNHKFQILICVICGLIFPARAAQTLFALGVTTNGTVAISTNFHGGRVSFGTNAIPYIGTNRVATVADITASTNVGIGSLSGVVSGASTATVFSASGTNAISNIVASVGAALFASADSAATGAAAYALASAVNDAFGATGMYVPGGGVFENQIVVPRDLSFSPDGLIQTIWLEAGGGSAIFSGTIQALLFSGNGSELTNLSGSAIANAGVISGLNYNGITNPPSILTIGAFQSAITNYAKIVSAPTNYNAYGEANWIARGWSGGTNFLYWYDPTSNRWQRVRAEVWP